MKNQKITAAPPSAQNLVDIHPRYILTKFEANPAEGFWEKIENVIVDLDLTFQGHSRSKVTTTNETP